MRPDAEHPFSSTDYLLHARMADTDTPLIYHGSGTENPSTFFTFQDRLLMNNAVTGRNREAG